MSDAEQQPLSARIGEERIPHDQLFKLLLTNFLYESLQLFFPAFHASLDTSQPPLFLEQEVFTDLATGEKHIADIVAQVRYRGRGHYVLVLTEHQSTPQSDFGERLFFYWADFRRKQRLPVYPIVVFSYTEPYRAEPSVWTETFADGEVLRFNYRVVQLNQKHWQDFVDNPNPVAAALMARMQFSQEQRPLVKLACLRMLVGLPLSPAQSRLIGVFVDSYLPLDASEQAKFVDAARTILPNEEEDIMELLTSWHRAGKEEGRQEGLQQGIEQGVEQAVIRLLQRRLGMLPDTVIHQIHDLSSRQRDALLDTLFELNSLDALNQWLTQNLPNK